MLPRWSQRNGRWHIDLGWLSLPAPGTSTQPPTPGPGSPADEEALLPFDVRSSSPAASDISASIDAFSNGHGSSAHPLFDAVRRTRSRFASFAGSQEPEEVPRTPFRPRPQRSRGVLFFLPAFFTQSQDMEMSSYRNSQPVPHIQPPPLHRSNSPMLPEKRRYVEDPELGGHRGNSISPEPTSQSHRLPLRPPYENRSASFPSTRTGSLVDVSSSGPLSTSRET